MLSTWDAFDTLGRVFDDVMGSSLGTATSNRAYAPAIDVRHDEDQMRFVCDVPGVKREDLDVSVENRVLTIRGTRRFEAAEKEQVVLGRTYGTFERSFQLPEYLDADNLSAELADGVLTIAIPKHPKAKPRRIPIGGGGDAKQLNG